MTAYRLLDQSEKAIQIGTEALVRFPDSTELRVHLAAALVEHGEADRAQRLISEIQASSQNVVVRYNAAMANEDWQTVSTLVDENLEDFPEAERKLSLCRPSRCKRGIGGFGGPPFDSLRKKETTSKATRAL